MFRNRERKAAQAEAPKGQQQAPTAPQQKQPQKPQKPQGPSKAAIRKHKHLLNKREKQNERSEMFLDLWQWILLPLVVASAVAYGNTGGVFKFDKVGLIYAAEWAGGSFIASAIAVSFYVYKVRPARLLKHLHNAAAAIVGAIVVAGVIATAHAYMMGLATRHEVALVVTVLSLLTLGRLMLNNAWYLREDQWRVRKLNRSIKAHEKKANRAEQKAARQEAAKARAAQVHAIAQKAAEMQEALVKRHEAAQKRLDKALGREKKDDKSKGPQPGGGGMPQPVPIGGPPDLTDELLDEDD